MNNRNKKNDQGKTINFAERKKEYNNRQNQASAQKNASNDNRVIQYDINKMREQINQQIRNRNSSTYKKRSPLWVKLVYSAILLIFVVLIAGRFTGFKNTFISNGLPDKFISESTKINSQDSKKYADLIENKINSKIKADGDIDSKTTSLRKNGNSVFASGYFNYPNESKNIYFDAKITSDNLVSLVVNGYELIK